MAIAVAVLRYRLYDIDRLINRTLVYGLLTAVLSGVYAATALVLVEKRPRHATIASACVLTRPPALPAQQAA